MTLREKITRVIYPKIFEENKILDTEIKLLKDEMLLNGHVFWAERSWFGAGQLRRGFVTKDGKEFLLHEDWSHTQDMTKDKITHNKVKYDPPIKYTPREIN